MASGGVFDEFTVDVSSVELIEQYREQIEENCNVKISYGLIFQYHTGDKQWVNIHGQYNDRNIAKEFVKALCNPQETLGVPYPTELADIVTNRTLIRKLERKTRAVILVDSEKCELCVQGSDVAVTLALSVIEELISSHQKGMIDSDTSPTTYVRQASARLEQEIRRLWSQDNTIVDDEDLIKMPDQVKRAILSCFTENDTGLKLSDHQPEEYKSLATNIDENQDKKYCMSHVDIRMSDLTLNSFETRNVLKNEKPQYRNNEIISSEADRRQRSPELSPDLQHAESSEGSPEHNHDNTQEQAEWPQPPTLAPSGIDLKNRHLLSYFNQLTKDFVEEDSNCSVEEFKRRNAERQKILHEAIREKGQVPQENVQPSVRTQKRTKKKAQQSQPNKTVSDTSLKGSHGKIAQKGIHVTKYHSPQINQLQIDPSKLQYSSTHSSFNNSVCTSQRKNTSQNNMSTYAGVTSPVKTAQLSEAYNVTDNVDNASISEPHKHFTPHSKQNRQHGQVSMLRTPTGQLYSPPLGNTNSNHNRCSPFKTNDMNPEQECDDKRYIVIDGSNVAMTHGNGKVFSCRGIQLCVDYFVKRSHTKITVFVPNWRKGNSQNPEILFELQQKNQLVFTPSRKIKGKNVACYDDRFIVRLADEMDGVIVSNDQYRDLMEEKEEWRRTIEERLLQYSFVGDFFMPPDDPLGQDGPTLDEFLSKSTSKKFKRRPVPPQQMQHTPRRLFPNDVDYHDMSDQPRKQSPWRKRSNPHRSKSPNVNKSQAFTELKGVPRRTAQQTELLLNQLLIIFPNNVVNVKKILQNHPCETDLNKLSTYILNVT